MMSDLAIWMAGYVLVPLFPTLAPETINQILTHSESKALFIGKLHGWKHMKPGVPAVLPCMSHPLSPDKQESPTRGEDELAALIYTSGTTGMLKGAMYSFGNFAWAQALQTTAPWRIGMMENPVRVGADVRHKNRSSALLMKLETGKWRIAHTRWIRE